MTKTVIPASPMDKTDEAGRPEWGTEAGGLNGGLAGRLRIVRTGRRFDAAGLGDSTLLRLIVRVYHCFTVTTAGVTQRGTLVAAVTNRLHSGRRRNRHRIRCT